MTTEVRKRKRKEETYSGFDALTKKVEVENLYTKFPVLKAQESRQLDDEFMGFYRSASASGFTVLEPLYAPQVLNRHALASGVLRTCIAAMATNIDGFGHTLEYIGPEGGQDSAEAVAERQRVEGVLNHPNGEYSLIDLRKRFRTDKESCGYGTIEVVRNADDGFPDMIHHVPSYTVRMTSQEKDTAVATRFMPRPGSKDNMMKVRTRFRRFVQVIGGKTVYFREPGDTRVIDMRTGRPISGGTRTDDNAASDMVMDMHYVPGSRYGAPRWIGDLRSVLGIQESENTNLGYFKDNGIPAMMLLVLGGAMTPQAQDNFKSLVQQSRGSGMQNKIVMIDIRGDENAASDKGMIQRPEVKLEPLMQVRQTDAFFQEYETNSGKKIRSSFRLPAIFAGLTEEVRMAVAQASLVLAESQVFGPERTQSDDLFNYQILTYDGVPMKYWRFKSNPPRIHDETAILSALKAFEEVGAMTPNIAIEIANSMFDMQIPKVDDGWGDMPFSFAQSATMDPITGTLEKPEKPEPPAQPTAPGAPTAPPAPSPDGASKGVSVRRRKRATPNMGTVFQRTRKHRDAGLASLAPSKTMREAGHIRSGTLDGHQGVYVTVGESDGDA